MKVSKSLLAVIAMAGTMGFSAVASAMDFSVYGSLRAGLRQVDTDDNEQYQTVVTGGPVTGTSADELGAYRNDDGEVVLEDVAMVADTEISSATVEAADAQLELGHRYTAAWSRIGIRGSEDLGNGAEAGLRWETGVGDNGSTDDNGRLANVWYSGAFGKVTMGQQGNPYRNAANWDQAWFQGGNNRYDDGGSRLQGIRYDGNAGAFNFSVMAVADNAGAIAGEDALNISAVGANLCTTAGDAATTTAGVAACASSATIEYAETEPETGVDSWIATGHYDMGVATINLGYQVNNNETQLVGEGYDNFVISANGSLDALDWYVAFETNTDNTNAKRTDAPITGTAAVANANVADAAAETAANATNATANANVMQVADAYATAQDNTTIGIFLGYHLSDVSTLYFEWEDTASDGLDVNGDNVDKNATLLGFSRSVGPNTSFIAEYLTVDYGSEATADSNTLVGVLKVDF